MSVSIVAVARVLFGGTHTPATHERAEPHALSHAPQLLLSVSGLTHEPPHEVVPTPQSELHTPALHDSVAPHM
jgi:hypothetical protein